MKRFILLGLIALLFVGCSPAPQTTVSETVAAPTKIQKATGETIYTHFSFVIVRVTIDGVNYLANSQGGIIKE